MYLLTATLLNAWRVFAEEEYGTEGDFLKVLRREPVEKTEAMQNGDDFEKWAIDNLPALKGGQYQVRVSRQIDNYLCYGIIDVLKAGVVIDIKFTSNYEVGKYRDNYQTPMYLALVPEAVKMQYIISNRTADGDLWVETYHRDNIMPIEWHIPHFENWLKLTGYWEIYKEHWGAKR